MMDARSHAQADHGTVCANVSDSNCWLRSADTGRGIGLHKEVFEIVRFSSMIMHGHESNEGLILCQ